MKKIYIGTRTIGSGVQAAECRMFRFEYENGEIEECAECPGKYCWVSTGSKFKRVMLVQKSVDSCIEIINRKPTITTGPNCPRFVDFKSYISKKYGENMFHQIMAII